MYQKRGCHFPGEKAFPDLLPVSTASMSTRAPSFCTPAPSLESQSVSFSLRGCAMHFQYSPVPWANPAGGLSGASWDGTLVRGAPPPASAVASSFLHYLLGSLDSAGVSHSSASAPPRCFPPNTGFWVIDYVLLALWDARGGFPSLDRGLL